MNRRAHRGSRTILYLPPRKITLYRQFIHASRAALPEPAGARPERPGFPPGQCSRVDAARRAGARHPRSAAMPPGRLAAWARRAISRRAGRRRARRRANRPFARGMNSCDHAGTHWPNERRESGSARAGRRAPGRPRACPYGRARARARLPDGAPADSSVSACRSDEDGGAPALVDAPHRRGGGFAVGVLVACGATAVTGAALLLMNRPRPTASTIGARRRSSTRPSRRSAPRGCRAGSCSHPAAPGCAALATGVGGAAGRRPSSSLGSSPRLTPPSRTSAPERPGKRAGAAHQGRRSRRGNRPEVRGWRLVAPPGLEPGRPRGAADFKSTASAISPRGQLIDFTGYYRFTPLRTTPFAGRPLACLPCSGIATAGEASSPRPSSANVLTAWRCLWLMGDASGS